MQQILFRQIDEKLEEGDEFLCPKCMEDIVQENDIIGMFQCNNFYCSATFYDHADELLLVLRKI